MPLTTSVGCAIVRRSAKRSPVKRSQSRNAAICALATSGPETPSRSWFFHRQSVSSVARLGRRPNRKCSGTSGAPVCPDRRKPGVYRTHRRLRRGIGRDRQSSHVADVAAGSVMQSAVKKAIAAARSSTTTLTWSNLLIVMSLGLAAAVRDGPADRSRELDVVSRECGDRTPRTGRPCRSRRPSRCRAVSPQRSDSLTAPDFERSTTPH